MPNIILTGDLNFSIIDWQIETTQTVKHMAYWQLRDFLLQFPQDQYIEEPTRRNNILDIFLTNNGQLTRHDNIIQIETNIKIVEEQQNHKFEERDVGFRDWTFLMKTSSE